jgi:hypothetical protein
VARLLSLLLLLCSAAGLAETGSALDRDPKGWKDLMPSDSKLNGWTRLPFPAHGKQSADSQWRVDPDTGAIICNGGKGHQWLRFDQEFSNFIFHVEWRFTRTGGANPRYNSGVYVRNNADASVWHQVQSGASSGGWLFGDTIVGNEIQRVDLRKEVKEERLKPIGEWNTYEVTAIGPEISIWTNGAVTNIYSTCEVARGYVGLEGEGNKIEFRGVKLKELP